MKHTVLAALNHRLTISSGFKPEFFAEETSLKRWTIVQPELLEHFPPSSKYFGRRRWSVTDAWLLVWRQWWDYKLEEEQLGGAQQRLWKDPQTTTKNGWELNFFSPNTRFCNKKTLGWVAKISEPLFFTEPDLVHQRWLTQPQPSPWVEQLGWVVNQRGV